MGRAGPREHFSLFLNKNVIRNEHLRSESPREDFSSFPNKNVIRNGLVKRKEPQRRFLIIVK